MASLVLTGDTSGQVTIAAPAVAGTTTLTLPATTGTVLNDATCGVCRAFVNFNGTGTVAIRADFNVTNITDSGTGLYTVNIDVDMTDENYSVSGAFMRSGAGVVNPLPFIVANGANYSDTFLAGSVKIICSDSAATRFDPLSASVAIFR